MQLQTSVLTAINWICSTSGNCWWHAGRAREELWMKPKW